jgi:hypothetical protein
MAVFTTETPALTAISNKCCRVRSRENTTVAVAEPQQIDALMPPWMRPANGTETAS